MWLCGFLEILQIITELKRSERAGGGGRVLLRAQFHFRFFFRETLLLPLAGSRKLPAPGGATAYKASLFTGLHAQQDDLTAAKSRPAARPLPSELAHVRLASTLMIICGITADKGIFNPPQSPEQNGKSGVASTVAETGCLSPHPDV